MQVQSQKISRFQKFESQDIGREQIQNAPYNPRYIDTAARNKLKEKIKKVGLVETLVWNKQTGNLVSGHQRLSILDELEKNIKEFREIHNKSRLTRIKKISERLS